MKKNQTPTPLDLKKWNMLSSEYKVAVKIYELTNLDQETAYYSKIVNILDGNPSKVTISKALDNLLDVGFVKADWKKDKNTRKWVRSFTIAGEAEDTIKGVYNHIHGITKV